MIREAECRVKKLLISAENAEFQIIQSLKQNRAKRAASGEIFIEGIESIKQALKAGTRITRIITTASISSWAVNLIDEIDHSEKADKPSIIQMTDDLYRKLCDRVDPSEMLMTAEMRRLTLGDLELPEKPFVLVLDRSSDTGNLGSIIRSANSFAVDAVLLIGHGVDLWDPKTIRASLGSVFFTKVVPLESLGELEGFIASMKAACGLDVWGTDSGGERSLVTTALKRPLMLILGNEAKGISVALKKLCDGIIGIPVHGAVNSLNLASAASIFMWEVYRNGE